MKLKEISLQREVDQINLQISFCRWQHLMAQHANGSRWPIPLLGNAEGFTDKAF
jgi:hypothetical protein